MSPHKNPVRPIWYAPFSFIDTQLPLFFFPDGSTIDQTRDPEPTPGKPGCDIETGHRYKHGGWTKPLACPGTGGPAS